MFPKIKMEFSHSRLAIAYKLMADALFILSSFLLATFAMDSLIPGISLAHWALTKIIWLIVLNVAGLYYLSSKIRTDRDATGERGGHKKKTAILAVLLVILAILSVIRLNLLLIISLSILAFLAAIMVYRVVSEKED